MSMAETEPAWSTRNPINYPMTKSTLPLTTTSLVPDNSQRCEAEHC